MSPSPPESSSRDPICVCICICNGHPHTDRTDSFPTILHTRAQAHPRTSLPSPPAAAAAATAAAAAAADAAGAPRKRLGFPPFLPRSCHHSCLAPTTSCLNYGRMPFLTSSTSQYCPPFEPNSKPSSATGPPSPSYRPTSSPSPSPIRHLPSELDQLSNIPPSSPTPSPITGRPRGRRSPRLVVSRSTVLSSWARTEPTFRPCPDTRTSHLASEPDPRN